MKINVKAQELRKVLSSVEEAVEKRTTIPLLGCVHLDARDGRIEVRATDLISSASAPLSGVVEEPGRGCVKFASLKPVVSALDCDLHLSSFENHWIEVKGAGSRYKMAGLDPELFPAFPQQSFGLSILAQEFKSLVSRCDFAAAQKPESKFALCGVLFVCSDGLLEAVATDGHRMSHAVVDSPGLESGFQAFVDLRSLPLLLSLGGESLEIGQNENYLFFKSDETKAWARKTTAQFPKWQNLLPKAFSCTATVRQQDLAAALTRASVFAEEKSKYVKVVCGGGKLTLECRSPSAGESVETLDCSVQSGSFEAGYNVDYLLAFASRAAGDVEIKFADPDSPLVLSIPGWDHLLMGMKQPGKT